MEKRPENVTRENEGANNGKGFDPRKTVTVLSIVAGVLAVGFICMLFSRVRLSREKDHLVSEFQVEKDSLMIAVRDLQDSCEILSSDYEEINLQLDSSRAEVAQLIERIQKTDATNRSQMRRYQKELGTLRSIMKSYIVQIDSLNTLNHKLTADAAAARRETAKVKKTNDELQKKVEELSDKVEIGAQMQGRELKAEAHSAGDRKVDRAKNATSIYTSLYLVENNLAEKGPVRIYVVVKDPEGNVLTNGESRQCSFGGDLLQTSASREIDYQGEEVQVGIFLKDVQLVKGEYMVQVLTDKALIGTTKFMLR